MIPFKDLVIRVKRKLQRPVDKSFMQGNVQGREFKSPGLLAAVFQVFKNGIYPFNRLWIS